jgi:FimV-like protein
MRNFTGLSSIPKRTVSTHVALTYFSILALSLLCHPVIALSAGELKILSSGQEPLSAEILLPRTASDNTDDILAVYLAAKSTYAQANLVYVDYLDQLQVNLVPVGGGVLIALSAPQPLSSSIDLLLEFRTSAQQYVHFYTLGKSSPETQVAEENLTEGIRNSDYPTDVSVHRVEEGDTLWNIARRLRPQGFSIAETMNQLFAENPDAFQNGDSTQIKLGYLLNLTVASVSKPNANSIDSIPEATLPQESIQLQDNEEALETALLDMAETHPEETQSQAHIIDQVTTPLSVTVTESLATQAEVIALVRDDSAQASQSLAPQQVVKDQVLATQQSVEHMSEQQVTEEQVLVEKASKMQANVELKKLTARVTQLTKSFKALFNRYFAYDSADDYRQLLTLPWLGSALILLTFLVLAMRSVSKRRYRHDNRQTGHSDEYKSEKGLADNSAEESVNYSSRAALNKSMQSSSDPKVETVDAIDRRFDDQNFDEKTIIFPGLKELEAQMEDGFFDSQLDSDGSQSQDMDDIDPLQVRLDMANICLEMGDKQTAREVLKDIILEAEEPAKAKAQAMLERLNTEMNG